MSGKTLWPGDLPCSTHRNARPIPPSRYTVTDLDMPVVRQEYSGAELMDKGLRITLTNQPAAGVFVYKKNP